MSRYPDIGEEIVDAQEDFRMIDCFRTRNSAEYYARMLNTGHAVINPHAIIGCRIEVK